MLSAAKKKMKKNSPAISHPRGKFPTLTRLCGMGWCVFLFILTLLITTRRIGGNFTAPLSLPMSLGLGFFLCVLSLLALAALNRKGRGNLVFEVLTFLSLGLFGVAVQIPGTTWSAVGVYWLCVLGAWCFWLLKPTRKDSANPEKNVTPTQPENRTTPKQTPESVSQPTTESVSQPTTESVSQPTPESVSQPTPAVVSQPTTEPTSQPDPQSTVEPICQANSQPASQQTTEAGSQSTSQPATESVSESMTSQPLPQSAIQSAFPENPSDEGNADEASNAGNAKEATGTDEASKAGKAEATEADEASEDETDEAEEADEEPYPLDLLPLNATQNLTRSVVPNSETNQPEDTLSGLLRVTFAAHQKSSLIYVAFCPPFAKVPVVECNSCDGIADVDPPMTILPHGVQIPVSRSETEQEESSVFYLTVKCPME